MMMQERRVAAAAAAAAAFARASPFEQRRVKRGSRLGAWEMGRAGGRHR